MEPERARPAGRARWLYLAIGWFFVGLGALGAVLPLLPTTPFLLVALWAFARSSRRFHDWLYLHPLFGPPLQAWSRHGVIPPIAKLAAVGGMSASLVWVIFVSPIAWWLWLPMLLVCAGGAAFVLSRPSRPPPGTGEAGPAPPP